MSFSREHSMQIGAQGWGECLSLERGDLSGTCNTEKLNPQFSGAKSGREPCFGKVGTGRGQGGDCRMFCTDKLSPYPHLKLLGKYVTCEKAACVCMCVCVEAVKGETPVSRLEPKLQGT